MKFCVMLFLCKQVIYFLEGRGNMIGELCIMAIPIGILLPIKEGMLFWLLYLHRKYMKSRKICLKEKRNFRLPCQRKNRIFFLQPKGIPWVGIMREKRK